MQTITTTLSQIAHSHPNPILFSDGIALALHSLLDEMESKFKFKRDKNKLEVKVQDSVYKNVFITAGVVIPPLDITLDCMLNYDPISRPKMIAYSHEATRIAIYIGTQKEFDGPIYKDYDDMGLVIYLQGINNITIEETASLILLCLDIYKTDERGFYTYWHGQDTLPYHQPVWPLGLVDSKNEL